MRAFLKGLAAGFRGVGSCILVISDFLVSMRGNINHNGIRYAYIPILPMLAIRYTALDHWMFHRIHFSLRVVRTCTTLRGKLKHDVETAVIFISETIISKGKLEIASSRYSKVI